MRAGLISLFVVAAVTVVAPQTSRAQLEACEDVFVPPTAMCEVLVQGGCTVMCQPVSFRAACAADLYVACDGMCTASASATCMASCDVSACQATCEVEPAMFSCRAECTAMATASCEAECSAMASDNEARTRCEASCEATFAARCEASCEATPPSATCMARCQASCEGRCEAEANVDCQVDCQASGYVDCEASLTGGCTAQCEAPEGALFCEGQWVDADDVDACIDALRTLLDIEVDASARGSAMCEGGMCTAEGEAEASASCAVAWGRTPREGLPFALLGLGLLALAGRRRR